MHFDLYDNASQLLVDQLHALEGRRLQTIDLLLGEDLEGHFGDEKVWPKRACISYRSLNVVICQGIERVNVADRLRVVLVEDVVESRASLQLRVSVLHEATLQELGIVCRILCDNIQHKLLLGLLAVLADLQTTKLLFFLVEHGRDLRANDWKTLFDVLDDNHVECAAEVWGAHARCKWCVGAARLEEVFLCNESLTDRLSSQDVFLRAADHSDIA